MLAVISMVLLDLTGTGTQVVRTQKMIRLKEAMYRNILVGKPRFQYQK